MTRRDSHETSDAGRLRGRRLLAVAGAAAVLGLASNLDLMSDPDGLGPSPAQTRVVYDRSSSSSSFARPPPRVLRSPPSSSASGSTARELSIAMPHGGCTVTYAHKSENPILPVWQASFPGSGSRMTWSLVEALTGIRTNDDYNSHERGYENVVAVKTHYPIKDARRKFNELDATWGFRRAMVILRNPMNAIPSYFNLQYEHLNHLPNHSTRGPNEDWIKYRESPTTGLAVQVANYEKFVDYWMTKHQDRRDLLLIAYEDLTDGSLGPVAAGRIANFLGETEGVDPIVPESVPCVWETIVNYKSKGPPPNKVGRRAQEEAAVAAAEVPPPAQNGAARRRTQKIAEEAGIRVDWDAPTLNMAEMKAAAPPTAKGAERRAREVGSAAGPPAAKAVARKAKEVAVEAVAPPAKGAERKAQQVGKASNAQPDAAARRKMQGAAKQNTAKGTADMPERRRLQEEGAGGSDGQVTLEVIDGVRYANGVQVPTGRTHAPVESLRTGPKVRPYSRRNLDDFLAMFARLAERYSSDEELVRIMASYVDVARGTPVDEGL